MPASETDPEGLCILHSRLRDKDQAAFDAAVKAKLDKEDYNFSRVFFPGPVCFYSQEFKEVANFSQAEFADSADFQSVKFAGSAVFESAKFSGNTLFYNAKFAGPADFGWAKFAGRASFLEAEFAGEARFVRAEFAKVTYFLGAKFAGPVGFGSAKFADRAIFRSINREREGEQQIPFQADFRGLELDPQERLQFQDLSLAQANFSGTDMRRLEFRHVEWYPYNDLIVRKLTEWLPRLRTFGEWFPGRQAAYNEVLLNQQDPSLWRRLFRRQDLKPPSGEDYARVEELYRGLKLSYTDAGDYKSVGDFHYGEMEMHRRASPWRRYFSWYSFYWALSGYGERPLRALIWLLALLLGLSVLGQWLGLALVNVNPPQPADFWDSFIFIFQKATLQRPMWAESHGFWGKLVINLSVLFLPGQAALFILALRNRLGRRR